MTITSYFFSILALSALSLLPLPAKANEFDLQPFELVRSFQRIQDEIALGDGHALGMQRELYKKVREELVSINPSKIWNERDLRAVLTFAMGGGGRSVLLPFEESFAQSAKLRDLAIKVNSLTRENTFEILEEVTPQKVGGALGVSIALVRGLNSNDLSSKIRDLNYARISMPGTLYEEAALRGLLIVYREIGEKDNFLRVASRYARTFADSPYSSQFASEIVAAALSFDDVDFRSGIIEILTFLRPKANAALRMRIARAGTVNSKPELFFAMEPNSDSDADAPNMASENDDAVLRAYNKLGSFSSIDARQTLDALELITPDDLRQENRVLHAIAIEGLRSIVTEDNEELIPTDLENLETAPVMSPDVMDALPDENDQMAAKSAEFEQFTNGLKGKIERIDQFLETIE